MTVRLQKSFVDRLGFGLVAAIEAHRQDLMAHRHTTGEPRPLAGPLIESCIRRVTVADQPDDFVADYEIEDDTPPPPTFLQKKNALMQGVAVMEKAAIDAVLPAPGKRRLHAFQHADIAAADSARVEALIAKCWSIQKADDERGRAANVKRVALQAKDPRQLTEDDRAFLAATDNLAEFVVMGRSVDDTAAMMATLDRSKFISSTRSLEDAEFMADREAWKTKEASILRHGADLHAQIEDLTEDTIDAWKPAEFPK
jgi:hypothetical protein